MTVKEFENISFRGRVGYAIKCFENLLVKLNLNILDWTIVLDCLWDFTSTDNMEDWGDKVSEIIPNNLLEFKSYEEGEFEFINKNDYSTLKKLYINSDESINIMIQQIYYLGCSHAYSVLDGKGESSLIELSVILEFMEIDKIKFPDISRFKKLSIAEDKGWGYPFDKQEVN